ncbi:MAG: Gfo/Idh/MocA family oxidoreductase [Alphaproteobacteria bacterium]|nr:Gfo/Idh/MocA family oxidoreductase [Alphaproteobacteria bacterium]
MSYKKINVAVIGAGWVGGIRANACASSPLVNELHIAEINLDRGQKIADYSKATSLTTNWKNLINNKSVDAIIIASTPESERFPIVRAALEAKKHVMIEKPIAPTLREADEAIKLIEVNNLKFTIGYTRRFDPKYAFINKSLKSGRLGQPVTCLISRNITREIGNKIKGRSKMSPAAMGGTHSIDFLLWCLQPRLPVKVYSQQAGKLLNKTSKTPDHQWIIVTMDDGTTITAGSGWVLPLGQPQYSQSWIEVIGTEGSLTVDDTHREVSVNTTKYGIRYPLSSMPGEQVDHVFAGAMVDETLHFLDAVANDKSVLATAQEARIVMEVTIAADLSAESGEAIYLN